MNIPKVLGTAFLKERLCWLLLVSKRILKSRKLVERLPLLYLVSCAKSLQAGQLPQEHLSFFQNLLNFIITKYLKFKSMTT